MSGLASRPGPAAGSTSAPASLPLRLGVLASGAGTNLQALLDACATGPLRGVAEVALVICNVPGAGALDRARSAGVPAELLPHGAFPDRASFDAALLDRLRAHRVELVCLAGFMRLLSPSFVAAYRGRVLNIHPSLLPSFPGLHAQRQALQAGVKITGVTVHLVDEGLDTGPIVAQTAVPVHDDDTEESLAARIRAEEHRIYPRAVGLFARGLVIEGRRVRAPGTPAAEGALANPP